MRAKQPSQTERSQNSPPATKQPGPPALREQLAVILGG